MHRRLPSLALLFAWICANGALLDAVQVLAWGKMFSAYVETETVLKALDKTFDPAKPCHWCVKVRAARETAKQHSPAAIESAGERILLALNRAEEIVLPAPQPHWPRPASARLVARCEPLPVPPPRA